MPLARASELRFVLSPGIELPHHRPEQAERTPPTGVVPDAGSDDPVAAGDSRHLPQADDGTRHEVHDELREGNVELAIGEGQLLSGGMADVDTGVTLTRGDHERLGWVDGRDCVG